jgi:hypothetical protein
MQKRYLIPKQVPLKYYKKCGKSLTKVNNSIGLVNTLYSQYIFNFTKIF